MTEAFQIDLAAGAGIVVDSGAVTPSSMSTGGSTVPRRRFQRGSLVEKSGRWYGVYRVDVLQVDGTFRRKQCWQPLGLRKEKSEPAAWRQFQPYLDRVNDAALKIPVKSGLTLADFVEEWRTNVSVNLKSSTVRAAESHLRAHIIPKLGDLQLTEITTKTVQGFVAHLPPAADVHERRWKTCYSPFHHFLERRGPGATHAGTSVLWTSPCRARA